MNPTDPPWSFAAARKPPTYHIAVDRRSPDVEHALDYDGTLCGIPYDDDEMFHSHDFRPDKAESCPDCRDIVAAAPLEPSGQERLHDLILGAEASATRDELAELLRRGVRIRLWLTGPANSVGKHYGRVDLLYEGREAAIVAVGMSEYLSVAIVPHGEFQFVVVIPEHGSPAIGRAPFQPPLPVVDEFGRPMTPEREP